MTKLEELLAECTPLPWDWDSEDLDAFSKEDRRLVLHATKMLPKLMAALAFYADPENWKTQYSGIGECPSEAESDGGTRANDVLAEANNPTP